MKHLAPSPARAKMANHIRPLRPQRDRQGEQFLINKEIMHRSRWNLASKEHSEKRDMLASATKTPCYLIVDDSPLSLKWLTQILRSIGPCKIEEVSDGAEAIQTLASAGERIDAVISDFRMPYMNGLELLREVRLARTGGLQSIPFFIVTGFAERALAGLALGLDVDAFLARPVKKQALETHLIRTCAERRAAKTPIEAQATYGDVDLSLAALSDDGFVAEPRVSHTPEATQRDASVTVLDERMMALESVPEGALLARDAVNGAGVVLLRVGEEMTAGLKAVLMSYAEIDESLAKVWVTSSD